MARMKRKANPLSRKYYVEFANIFRVYRNRAKNAGDTQGTHMVEALTQEFADMFHRDNVKFDRERFAKASR